MKNQKGFTLVELLASLTIATIVLVILYSLISQTQAEHHDQYANNKKLMQMNQIVHILTSDIRQATSFTTTPSNIELPRIDGTTIKYQYDEVDNTLTRNDVIIANDLNNFSLTVNSNSISIQINNLKNETVSTTIYLRSD